MNQIIKLKPSYKSEIWGGENIKKFFNRKFKGNIAESWELSLNEKYPSYVGNTKLKDFLIKNKLFFSDFNLIIKYIDAKENLSIQVHPSTNGAKDGKIEMWYILDAKQNAGIYYGLKNSISKNDLKKIVLEGTIQKYLNFVSVKKGDCFLIDSGIIHCIGAGCTLCEVQNNCDVTYRLYDYDRLDKNFKKRELHIDQGLKSAITQKQKPIKIKRSYKKIKSSKIRTLTKCDFFECDEIILADEYVISNNNTLYAINVIKGSGYIENKKFFDGDSFLLKVSSQIKIKGSGVLLITCIK